jgi:hypothetical protein
VTKRTRVQPGPGDTNTTGLGASQSDLARYDELRSLLEQIREATRLGHEVLKDLRIETRQAQRLLPMIVAKRIKVEINKQLAELSDELGELHGQSVETIIRSFDTLYEQLIGSDHWAKKEGLASLPELARKMQAVTAADLLTGETPFPSIKVGLHPTQAGYLTKIEDAPDDEGNSST